LRMWKRIVVFGIAKKKKARGFAPRLFLSTRLG